MFFFSCISQFIVKEMAAELFSGIRFMFAKSIRKKMNAFFLSPIFDELSTSLNGHFGPMSNEEYESVFKLGVEALKSEREQLQIQVSRSFNVYININGRGGEGGVEEIYISFLLFSKNFIVFFFYVFFLRVFVCVCISVFFFLLFFFSFLFVFSVFFFFFSHNSLLCFYNKTFRILAFRVH